MFSELLMPSNHLILCHPLLLCPQSFPASRSFLLHIRWQKYWSFTFSSSPSKEYPGLISLKTDWLDRPAFQGTLNCLLQDHNSKASILLRSALFTVQLSHPHLTPGKTITLTTRAFVGKVVSLFFNQVRPSKVTVQFYCQRIYWIIFCFFQLYTEWLKLIWMTNKLSSDRYYCFNQI